MQSSFKEPVGLEEENISELTESEFKHMNHFFGMRFYEFHRGTLPEKE